MGPEALLDSNEAGIASMAAEGLTSRLTSEGRNGPMQPPHPEADSILSRFPGPVTLYSSRRKWLRLTFACSLFTIAGILMVFYGISDGWFFLVVFGTLSTISVGMLLPGASSLKLDKEGFQATRFYKRHRVRWQDVRRFDAVQQYRSEERIVVYDDLKSPDTPLVRLNKFLADHNAFLPDTYGLAGQDLAWLMGEWRERAAGHFRT
ncbi:MAG TPA: hypothetical protein VF478_11960 [Anaerolineae bacterium]|jgi:hypothetical protein